MLTIHKFIIPFTAMVDSAETILLPDDAQILTVQKQGHNYCIWAKVDTSRNYVPRKFVWHGTGTEELAPKHTYIGTVQDDPFVWHLFELQTQYTTVNA